MGYKSQLLKTIEQIHADCHKLCMQILGKHLQVAGNIGVFCQTDNEYKNFTKLRIKLTEPSNDQNQKYYRMYNPISIGKTIYTHVYIRKPDSTTYGRYLGDIDFILEPNEYIKLKDLVAKGRIKGAEIYDRPGWDTIQITDPHINSVAYISTKEFAEKVRAEF